MERGFKSRCERMARSLRIELGLGAADPLPPERLASHLDVAVWPVNDLGLSQADVDQLVVVDPDSWSAVTVSTMGREAIIINPTHIGGRYSSDVMHELAHLLLRHKPNTVFFADESELALYGYDRSTEDEANWLAAALLLPREALMHLRRRRISPQETCERYGVSRRMLAFRINVTGVNRQFRRRSRMAR